MLVRMAPNSSDLVNAQDRNSENALSYAVTSGFVEGIDWLVEYKIDVHDDDASGNNCFHKLAERKEFPVHRVREIANSLLALKIDWRKQCMDGRTPLYTSLVSGNETLTNFLLDQYDKEGVDGESQHQLLPVDSDGFSLMHRLAVFPYSERVLQSVLKFTSRNLDIYRRAEDYYAQPLDCYARPLDMTIVNGNVGIAKYILSQGSYKCGKGHLGFDEVDRCCDGIETSTEPELTQKRKEILALLFQYAPAAASRALRFPLFDRQSSTLSYSEQLSLISWLDQRYINEHGWTMYDFLSSLKLDRHHILDSIHRDVPTQHQAPSRFTRFGERDQPYYEMSESGLELSQAIGVVVEGKEEEKEEAGASEDSVDETTSVIYLADHPCPLYNKTSYFEVEFTLHKRKQREDLDADSNRFYSVGLRSAARDLPSSPEPYIGIEYTSKGLIKSFLGLLMESGTTMIKSGGWLDKSTHQPGNSFLYEDVKGTKFTAGCAVNLQDGILFFTLDGEMLPRSYPIPLGPLVPVISMCRCEDWLAGFKANFGVSPFVFENANRLGWEWDGKTPEFKMDGIAYKDRFQRNMMLWDAIQPW
ncbi:hypothetical protein H072_11065 [Dactylellina haptotyla CBS 200.50]|uniref:Uncharacterized protein n=1 Tax=Dactylellina haptotyla (strain CBS 200.50) TaxID=1284197 RepID=S7ZXM6_DACHA|nr:hypothetical protein H072_11065 [Dactylellina haptotyla CBS 200.50]